MAPIFCNNSTQIEIRRNPLDTVAFEAFQKKKKFFSSNDFLNPPPRPGKARGGPAGQTAEWCPTSRNEPRQLTTRKIVVNHLTFSSKKKKTRF